MTEYTTKQGERLQITRLPRQILTKFLFENQQPQPPTRTVTVFGGGSEEVKNYEDPKYKRLMAQYDAGIYRKQFDVMWPAIQCDYSAHWIEMSALYHIGMERGAHIKADILRYIVLKDIQDANYVCKTVVYNSTITRRAIQEAYAEFDVMWLNTPVHKMTPKMSPASVSGEFEAMQAARHSCIPWDRFCELTGQEQSKVVAFFRVDRKLENLRG